MMKLFFSLLLLGATTLAAPAPAPAQQRTIVLLKDDVQDVASHFAGLHLPVPASYMYEGPIKGFAGEFNEAALALIHADPMVASVEKEIPQSASTTERFSGYGLAISSQSTRLKPNNQNEYYYQFEGTGVIVYVVDTGIQASNPDFQGRATNTGNFVTRQYGFADEGNTDNNGHGTAVAGCAGGRNWGTAKNATIRGVKVLDASGKGHSGATTAGINYAINNCGSAKCVINLSLGGDYSSTIDSAVATANRMGMTVVAAAGNQNVDACSKSPAGAPAAITVASIDHLYNRSPFSNYGSCVDTFAPGQDIITDSFNYPVEPTTTINGTSFSSPYVAGIAATYLSGGASGPADVKGGLKKYGMTGQVGDPNGSPNILANNGYFQGFY